MNKNSITAAAILIVMSMIELAHANDDSPDPNDPSANNESRDNSLLNRWTGFYTGVDAGFIFGNTQLKSQHPGFSNPGGRVDISSDFSTFFPGIQLGYIHQFTNRFVLGTEANVTFNTHQEDTLSYNSDVNANVYDRFKFSNQLQTSIKIRVGRAIDWKERKLLPYITAGVSFAQVRLKYENEGGDQYSNSALDAGWLIGAGIDWAFKKNWSLRAEYFYVGYGNIINLQIPSIYGLVDPNGNARIDHSSNNIAISINYWI